MQVVAHRLQGADSKFSTYVSNLPVGVSGIPMFFPGDAIAAIEYPPVSEQVKKRCKWLYEFSQNNLAKLPETPEDPFSGVKVDINALGWALACVTSRAFRVRGPSHPAACLPLIDMANHSFTPNAEVLPTPNGVGLFAKRKVAADEPLLLSYGPLSNDFLFMDYGFIVPDNPHDRVQLRFDVGLLQTGALIANVRDGDKDVDIRVAGWQRKILADLQLDGPGANLEVTLGGEQHVDPRLLAAARVLLAKSEAEIQGRTLERLGRWGQPLSRANETKALRTLSGVAAVALSRFTTTLDQDEEALRTGVMPAPPAPAAAAAGSGQQVQQAAAGSGPGRPMTEELRSSVRFRVEKKKLLSRAIQAMGVQLKQLAAAGPGEGGAAAGSGVKGQPPKASTSKGFGK
mmetsp:Transcript_24988/g.54325  ORF Transcript_24988/g.54325 Transcript_24988/m.54325 type:complete len:401 (+) Transcript_24988:697-1899(+)